LVEWDRIDYPRRAATMTIITSVEFGARTRSGGAFSPLAAKYLLAARTASIHRQILIKRENMRSALRPRSFIALLPAQNATAL
jgi:hypothetical protein